MAQPIPLKGATSSNAKPRRTSMSTRTTRRRSSSTVKEQPSASSWTASSHNPPRSLRLREQQQPDADDSEEEADAPDGEVKGKVRGKRTKKGAEVFQCEKCAKWYRHPACLTKHRWQHTDYWQSTASLMMSKHQSVMMLEAAAILTNAGSLPEEKSLWPAAVSPPQSGLLGSDNVNTQVLQSRVSNSPAFNSFSSLPPVGPLHDHHHAGNSSSQPMDAQTQHSSDDTEDTSPESGFDDFDDMMLHNTSSTTRDTSPADASKNGHGTKEEDEEEMFALDMGDLKVVEEEPVAESHHHQQQQPTSRMQPSPVKSRQPSFAYDWSRRHTGLTYGDMGSSLPSMGFFEPRKFSPSLPGSGPGNGFAAAPSSTATSSTNAFGGLHAAPLPTASERSSAGWMQDS